jgi:prolyl 4-hydroxylase
MANGVAGPRDWQGALARLRDEARRDPKRKLALGLLDKMTLTEGGDPVRLPSAETLSERPDVRRIERLFTAAECDYLRQLAEPEYMPSVVNDAMGRQVRDPIRTSDGATIHWMIEDPAVHALNRRLAAASGSLPEQGEPLQVLRYRPGEQYRMHFDAIAGFANPRVMTMIVWLNSGFCGGETHFPTASLTLRGAAGDAILFRNADAEGRRDPASAHAGLPVTSGEKIIASRWIRSRPFEPPVGGRAG